MPILKSKPSIYKRIASKTGKKKWLPPDFSLPETHGTPGEADGMLLYHTEIEELRPEAFEKCIRLLKAACQAGPKKRKEGDIEKYLEEHRVFLLIDRLNAEIFDPARDIDFVKLLDIAFVWATTSNNPELIKLAISLMGMFNLDEWEECKKIIITLGKYEEFTFYSLFAVSGWDGADEIAGDYAKHLKGWGKTHAEVWLEQDLKEPDFH